VAQLVSAGVLYTQGPNSHLEPLTFYI